MMGIIQSVMIKIQLSSSWRTTTLTTKCEVIYVLFYHMYMLLFLWFPPVVSNIVFDCNILSVFLRIFLFTAVFYITHTFNPSRVCVCVCVFNAAGKLKKLSHPEIASFFFLTDSPVPVGVTAIP